MVSAKDPIESFFNSFQGVKDAAFAPLELRFQKVAKDFETSWGFQKSDVKLVDGLKFDKCTKHESKVHFFPVKKKALGGNENGDKEKANGGIDNGGKGNCVVSEERKKGSFLKIPITNILGMFFPNLENSAKINGDEKRKVSQKEREMENEDASCVNCFKFAVTWSLLVNGFVQSMPSPFKLKKRRLRKFVNDDEEYLHLCNLGSKPVLDESKKCGSNDQYIKVVSNERADGKEGKNLALECVIGFILDQLAHLQKFDQKTEEIDAKANDCDSTTPSQASPQFDHMKAFLTIWESRKVDVNGFLGNLKFARVGGVSNIVGVSNTVDEDKDDVVTGGNSDDSGGNLPQKLASGILSIPLSNVERLRSTLSTVSLTELIELLPQLGRSSKEHPDKKKLFSVQDFFRYTEAEGRRFFEELDRDGDGQVNLEDLEIAMRKRKLPRRYAREFMQRTRRHLFAKSFGWNQFLSLMEQKEPTILRAYTSLCLSKSGTLQKSEILSSLKNAGLPANEDNAVAMMRFLNADTEESISYGHFRNFMLLLPSDRLQDDPRSIWFEAATVVAVAPPVEIPAGSVLRSALAGGLSCALSCSLLHPVDTIKTRVQASTLTFPEIISKLPQIGVRGLYRGSIPAIWGQFTSHGLRTGIFEASRLLLINVAPMLPELQVQSISSFCSTVLGTAIRIPCEVLKQRLQAGLYGNVGEALVATWHQDGLKGFFRGTGATLCREVPFYVAGMGLYAESKKAVQHMLRRDLEPWETILVGALSGGLAAVVTTPFDVMKTRMMTAQGRSVPMTLIAFSILRREGPLGLFKGAVPRFFWIAPLGAMNFAGYELARKAMNKTEEQANVQVSEKKLTNTT